MQGIKISLYLTAFTISNLLVHHFGETGLIITALFFIPFDFVMRCDFQEQYDGRSFIFLMTILVVMASTITIAINHDAQDIAMASVGGFVTAQITAAIFYRRFITRPLWFKVNGSDLVGIVFDSIIFQLIAFHGLNGTITISQVAMKFVGGLFWYWVLFKKYKLFQR